MIINIGITKNKYFEGRRHQQFDTEQNVSDLHAVYSTVKTNTKTHGLKLTFLTPETQTRASLSCI